MKVLCIHGVKIGEIAHNFLGDVKAADITSVIFEGEIYTVVEDIGESYVLQERNPIFAYGKRRFAPLSEINETEFERNYQKELS